MAEPAGAVARYLAYVTAEMLRPLLPRGARVADFSEGASLMGPHLEAGGARVLRGEETGLDGAFAEVREWRQVRGRAAAVASRLAPGAPLLLRLRRAPGQRVALVVRDLAPAFDMRPVAALGLLVPFERGAEWAERHPQTFGLLCALEGAFRTWPLLRTSGRESVLLGVRRPEAA